MTLERWCVLHYGQEESPTWGFCSSISSKQSMKRGSNRWVVVMGGGNMDATLLCPQRVLQRFSWLVVLDFI
jgi:hypothetical protein